jgi:small-conductance mechanosensitive channel
MIRYRHILSAIALLLCLAATTVAAPTPTASPRPTASPESTVSPRPTASPRPSSLAAPTLTPAVSPSASATAAPAAAATPAPVSARASVLSYLGQIIAWYRTVTLEEQTTHDPEEILYVADNRQMAGEVLPLAFAYARAQAALITATAGEHPQAVEQTATNSDLVARRAAKQSEVASLTAKVAELTASVHTAGVRTRDLLNRQLAAAQGQLDLAQMHVESLNALIDYEQGSGTGDTSRGTLSAQIDELEAALPHDGSGKTATPASAGTVTSESPAPSAGFLERGEYLMVLQRRQQSLDDAYRMTSDLVTEATAQRDQLVRSLRDIDDQSVLQANDAATSANIATARETRDAFKQLTARRKLVGNAMEPLSKQIVTLKLYRTNLQRWRLAISRQLRAEVRSLLLRAAALGLLFALVFLAAIVWRKLTYRYVPDLHRRYQLMQLRRFAIGTVIALILLFGLGGDLRVFATVMGFAAAGIALALQNVILSFAGYFYIGGRFGIRVGDRIQLVGISGDVLEIGLFKLTLMELTNDASGSQPTGRIVVFPNSIVFQPNGNFFNQLPGSNYRWNELRLSLAPDCDYRLAEQRVVEVIGAVFSRFRESIQRDYRNVESNLNQRFESPRPQSRLQFTATGIEVVVRYPVPLTASAQAADDITRRLIDTLNREPGMRLVAQGSPALQRADPSSDDSAAVAAVAANAQPPNHPDSTTTSSPVPAAEGNAGITPAAAAVAGAAGLAAASVVEAAANPPANPNKS